jgi:hypothetical protein
MLGLPVTEGRPHQGLPPTPEGEFEKIFKIENNVDYEIV